jgi:DnaJ-domain-containing protein 1
MEFWGNFLLNTAKSQQQLENVAKWMKSGFSGFEEFSALFQKVYGLENVDIESPDYSKVWAGAQEDFIKSFKDYLALLGVVPLDEHLALVKKYEALKEKADSQEETIKHLRMLFTEGKKEEFEDVSSRFEELAKKQGEQFQKLMESFTQSPKKTGPSKA